MATVNPFNNNRENVAWLSDDVGQMFSADFLDETICTTWFLNYSYPDGPACPDCGTAITTERLRQSFRSLARFTCPECQGRSRATKGTLLEGSHLTPRSFYTLCFLLSLDVDLATIAKAVDLSVDTVRTWRDKLQTFAEVGE